MLVTLYREHAHWRKNSALVSSPLLILGVVMALVNLVGATPRQFSSAVWIVAGALLIVPGVNLGAIIDSLVDSGRTPKAEMAAILEERARLQERIQETEKVGGTAAEDVFDRLSLTLNEQREYFTINKAQARSSFRFGVFAILSGLVTLVAGIWLFYLRPSPNLTLTALSSISSILVQLIGASALYVHRQSQAQVTYFYDRLVRLQETMIAIRLAEQIGEEGMRDRARESVAMALIGRHGGVERGVVEGDISGSVTQKGKPRRRPVAAVELPRR